jgi:PAS domain S-box-containing protein
VSPLPAANNSGLEITPCGGEMERRIDSLDWSGTSIGPRENWSQALRTTVRILLANRFPLLLWWGPDYISIYNDAYIPILGQKHPWGLGKPVSECWSEIWNVLKPLIDTPFYGGPATWSDDIELYINRAGFMEETHFTVAYSPVPDETAERGIGGVLATVHEISAEIVGQRRGIVLRELASTVEAKTANEACINAAARLAPYGKDIPFALIYLAGEDGNATLAAASGIEGAEGIAPATIRMDDSSGLWPLHEARRTGRMQLVNLSSGLSSGLSSRSAPIRGGTWSDPPNRAALLPVRSHLAHGFSGFFIAGLSSRLRLDDSYTDFLNLVTSQIATAISTARAYEEERKRAEALAEIDRAKTAFFSNVSHEFRTPLTLMLGPLEEILKEDQLATATRERAELAHRNSLRLLKLVNSLLEFSRIEAGRIKASYTAVDLTGITRDLTSNFRSAAEAGGLKLVVNCGPLREPVYVDVEMWEKIVLNLLSNAFKFTFEGTITVTLAEVGERVILSVADTGIGIPDAELPRIFERFHRMDGAKGRSYEGTGIGLALVQELVKAHGGKITVRSDAGTGTTFYVEIPRGHGHLPPDRVRTVEGDIPGSSRTEPYVEEALRWLPRTKGLSSDIAREAAGGSVSLKHALKRAGTGSNEVLKPRVLLADDNADMRDYVARLLGERMQVTAVNNGMEALESALEDPPDLILSDIMMPVLDGSGLLREVRGNPDLSHIPVILLSARAGEESRVDGVSAGADDYLVKPFSAAELLARVTTHLKLSGQRQETVAMLRQLQDVSTRLIGESDLTTLLGEFLDAAIGITHADMGNVQLLDAATGELRMAAQRGFDRPFPEFFKVVHAGIAACGFAMEARQRVVIGDVASSAAFDSTSREVMLKAGARAIQSTPLVTRSGKLVGVLSTHYHAPARPADRELQMMDVLARQAADLIENSVNARILRESEERFRTLVTASSDVVYHMSGDWSEMRHLVGRDFIADTREPNKALAGQVHSSGRPARVTRTIQEAIRNKSVFALEHRVIRTDGTFGWTFSRAVPILNDAGEIIEWLGAASDITDLKIAEEALRESEECFRQLAEAGPQIVWISGPQGELEFVNRRWVEFSGLDFEEMRDPEQVQSCLHPEDDVLGYWQRSMDSGTPFELEARLRSKGGEFRWFMMRSIPVRDEQGRIRRWFGTSTDIHAGKLLQLELQRANQDLEQFAYSASHDLQEPLRSVKIFSELLFERCSQKLVGQELEFLQNVRDGAGRMEMLVRDLREYTWAAKVEKASAPVDSKAAFDAPLANLAGAISETGATIACDSLPSVSVNATQLQQLFQNLVGNALKYHRSGVAPVVRVTARREKGMWVFSLRDNGIGIDARYRENIFG